MEPEILVREDHPISRKDISREAIKVLYRLREMNYKAYLAGGCVRDLMLGLHPKDFDVATDAAPNDVKAIFRNCRIIGRRFRLAHVYFRDTIIEVATFRSNVPEEDDVQKGHVAKKDGLVTRDNHYGTPEEDALRRDFTINAMFYDIDDFSIIDYAGGLEDLKKRLVRCIGDPEVRYREDPVRMIRAVRFASSCDLTIEEKTYQGILDSVEYMSSAAPARMFEEVLKFFHCGAMVKVLPMLRETGLLKVMLPEWATWLDEEATEPQLAWVNRALKLMDDCKAHGIVEQPSVLFGLLFGSYHEAKAQPAIDAGAPPAEALEEVIRAHHKHMSDSIYIPQREILRMVRIAASQQRFRTTEVKQANRFAAREYFNDAFAYFKFTCRLYDQHNNRLTWWEEYLTEHRGTKKKTRRRRKKKSAAIDSAPPKDSATDSTGPTPVNQS